MTVGRDRVFVNNWHVIDVHELNGVPVCSFGERTLSEVRDIAAGSDGQIFVLDSKFLNNEKIARVFNEDGHQQNEFRVHSREDDYCCLASYPSGEYIVFSGFERKTRRLKVAMYCKDGVFNRSVTLGERLGTGDERYKCVLVFKIAVTNDDSVVICLESEEDQRNIIVCPIKHY